MIVTRTIRAGDAGDFLDLCKGLDAESQFMMLEPGERSTTVEEQRKRIEAILAKENQTVLVAESGGRLIGYIAALGGSYRRNRHTAHIVIGIRQAFTGQGLGTRLFGELMAWACECKLHRLELTVMAHNERALALYKKMGFGIEGTKRHSLVVDGAYVDEYYMAKLLP